MAKHRGLGEFGELWLPPGGGVEYGSHTADNLKREFIEETGLSIKVDEFLFGFEFLQPPLHAIELFFKVESTGGKLEKGLDPELPEDQQIIEEVRFVTFEELRVMDKKRVHQAFQYVDNPRQIVNLRGFFNFENNYLI